MAGLLSRERSIAQPGFNRWLVLVAGFLCNLAVRPVADRDYMSETELERERSLLRHAVRA